jgi:group I intron endonuclease
MKVDYSKGKIYKITNDFNNDIYVGSSCDTLIKRFSYHKKDSKKEKNKEHPFYKLMNEIGHTRFRIQLVEDCPCEDTYQLRQREGHFIREMGTLNLVIAGRTRTEYKQDNKEKLREKEKEYRENNKEIINKKKKEFRKEHKEEIKEYKKTPITCECGACIQKGELWRHKKTQKHQLFLTQKI